VAEPLERDPGGSDEKEAEKSDEERLNHDTNERGSDYRLCHDCMGVGWHKLLGPSRGLLAF
jgi:hypothetical protein